MICCDQAIYLADAQMAAVVPMFTALASVTIAGPVLYYLRNFDRW